MESKLRVIYFKYTVPEVDSHISGIQLKVRGGGGEGREGIKINSLVDFL